MLKGIEHANPGPHNFHRSTDDHLPFSGMDFLWLTLAKVCDVVDRLPTAHDTDDDDARNTLGAYQSYNERI